MSVMDQHRHHTLGIDLFVIGRELLSREDIDGDFFERQSLSLKATRTLNDAIERQNP
jgi:hypothetical protein